MRPALTHPRRRFAPVQYPRYYAREFRELREELDWPGSGYVPDTPWEELEEFSANARERAWSELLRRCGREAVRALPLPPRLRAKLDQEPGPAPPRVRTYAETDEPPECRTH